MRFRAAQLIARVDLASAADAADARTDAPDAAPDRSAADASDVRPEEQPCGPLGFNCAPFACDVARGVCKTTCGTNDDCVGGRRCIRASCGPISDPTCSSNDECNSGICAQGVCCQSACSQICWSCAVTGAAGTCTPVPTGVLDPANRCPPGLFCDGRGQCMPPRCTGDVECASSYLCTNGRCVPCAATCVSDSECGAGSCIKSNLCSYCAVPDAGTI